MKHLLLIDDDYDVLLINKKYFEHEGYSVSIFDTPLAAIDALSGSLHPDCIVLDVMMPDMDGFTALKHIRKLSSAPVIFLTGKDSEDDRINGLLSGAEDYIIKPYSLRELSARITVQLRKHSGSDSPTEGFSFPPLFMDFAQHKVFYNVTEEVILSNREYEFLYLLMSRAGQIIPLKDLGQRLWGTYSDQDKRAVMVIASRLRKKLESYTNLENIIETHYGKGYQFTLSQK